MGSADVIIELANDLFYKILGEETGVEINSDNDLMPLLKELIAIRKKYDKIANALSEVEATGYGIVMPQLEGHSEAEPQISDH